MTQTTITAEPTDPTHGEDGEMRVERLRAAAPLLVSVTALFGLLVAGALGLRELTDVGVWLLSSY